MAISPSVKKFILSPPSETGLIYDLEAIVANAVQARKALKDTSLSFAVKSFPRANSLSKILCHLSGADVSNIKEWNLIGDLSQKPDFTVWLTRCPVEDFSAILKTQPRCRIWYTVEDTSVLPALLTLKKNHAFSLALRVRSSDLLHETHPLRYVSRFGFRHQEASDVLSANAGVFEGLHLHHGSEKNDTELFRVLHGELVKLKKNFSLKELNLGGGWNLHDEVLIKEISAAGAGTTVEPGRFFTERFGYAFCRISGIRQDEQGTFLEGRLSPSASLKWSRNMSFSIFPTGDQHQQLKHPLFLAGPSCFEGDHIQLTESGTPASASPGDILLLTNVAGYSMAWNHSFNGIETPVYVLGEDT